MEGEGGKVGSKKEKNRNRFTDWKERGETMHERLKGRHKWKNTKKKNHIFKLFMKRKIREDAVENTCAFLIYI